MPVTLAREIFATKLNYLRLSGSVTCCMTIKTRSFKKLQKQNEFMRLKSEDCWKLSTTAKRLQNGNRPSAEAKKINFRSDVTLWRVSPGAVCPPSDATVWQSGSCSISWTTYEKVRHTTTGIGKLAAWAACLLRLNAPISTNHAAHTHIANFSICLSTVFSTVLRQWKQAYCISTSARYQKFPCYLKDTVTSEQFISNNYWTALLLSLDCCVRHFIVSHSVRLIHVSNYWFNNWYTHRCSSPRHQSSYL